MPPIPTQDPANARSDMFSAPTRNGDSSDSRTKNPADDHPSDVPYAIECKLAKHYKYKNNYSMWLSQIFMRILYRQTYRR